MRVAVVTGAASGIGLAIAESLSADFQVVCWDINSPPPGHQILDIGCDVSDEKAIGRAYQETHRQVGPISVLINNCGLQYMSPVEEFPTDKWDLLMNVMLRGSFLCSKTVVPDMKERGWGRIVNVSSIHGKVASPYKAAYVAAKHGVIGLSKVMALELAGYGTTVNSICPGFVDTPLMRQQVEKQMQLNNLSEDQVLSNVFLKDQCIKSLTSTSQVADLVRYLISDSASTITGEALSISGGWGMGY